ncbi:helix-turn-helix domain-containing protein [Nocardia sp. NPDC005366]|uniref:helix-turn-helix domain-containing protein n=1 Tax=Nocardia sp. NPDC005366 TaxID=3156878 RepID=UPI0033B61817
MSVYTRPVRVSPKHFARIGRVRHVIAQVSDMPLARIAADSGYYDQSHMSADFKALMGVPPAGFIRGNLPAPTSCRDVSRPVGPG